jgi:hypothetical protein
LEFSFTFCSAMLLMLPSEETPARQRCGVLVEGKSLLEIFHITITVQIVFKS